MQPKHKKQVSNQSTLKSDQNPGSGDGYDDSDGYCRNDTDGVTVLSMVRIMGKGDNYGDVDVDVDDDGDGQGGGVCDA